MILAKFDQNIKNAAMFLTAMILVVIAFFIPSVFADPLSGSFSGQPIPVYSGPFDYSIASSSSLYQGSSSSISSEYAHFACSATSPCYVFRVNNTLYFASQTSNNTAYWGYYFPSSSTISGFNGLSVKTFNSSFSLYYNSASGSNNAYADLVPNFSSRDEGFSAVLDAIANPPSPPSPVARAVVLSTSYTTIDTGSYVKSSVNGAAGLALWSPDGGSTLRAVTATIDPNCFVYRSTDTSSSPVTLYPSASIDDCYYNTFTTVSSDQLDIGFFPDLNSAVQAIYDLLIGSGTTPIPIQGHYAQLELPPGYVAVINASGNTLPGVTLTANMGGLSLSRMNKETGVYIGQVSSIPISPFSFPVDGTSLITSWSGLGDPSLVGTYNNFTYSFTGSSGNGSFILVVNPHTSIQLDSYDSVLEVSSLTVSGIFLNASLFALKGSVSLVDGDVDYSAVSTNQQYQYTYDDSTGTWNLSTSDGAQVDSLPYGGANSTFVDNFETTTSNFFSWLQTAIKNIGVALDTGKSAIMTLVSYASGFFGVIQSIYAWLPAPVYSVLTSAIVLVITIGIIKVFI